MTLTADTKNRMGVALALASAGAELAGAVDASTAMASGAIAVGDANGVAQDVVPTGDVTISNTGVTAIGAGKVTNAMINPNSVDGTIAKNVGVAGDVIGGLTLTHIITIADASADTDTILTHKSRVIKFEYLDTGIGAHATLDTVQLKNGATAITDAVAKTATVNALVRAATYDPAQVVILAGGTLRITAAKNTNVAGIAIVTVVRSA